jgi:hypothetical protein
MNRTSRMKNLLRLAAILLCAALARPSRADDRVWKAASSLNYESGDYGTGVRSSSLYVPFTLKRSWGDFNASLTVPFVSQTSDGQVSNVGGRPVRTGKGRAAGVAAAATTTHSGLGDVIARGGWAIMEEDPRPFDLTAVVKLKLPTASKSKGLGTGEFDAGVGAEFAKTVAPGWTALADLYFTKIGDPPGQDLNNQVAADVGVSKLLAEHLTATALLEASNALVDGEPSPRDLRGILDYALNDRTSLSGGVMIGLSKGSADYGFSLGGSFRF